MTESTALTVSEAKEMATLFATSGMFKDAREMAQAFVQIQAGQEIGVPPFAAMTGIHIIQGKPSMSAGLIAGRIKGSGKYDYRVHTMDDKICILVFFEAGQEIGESRFTIEDANAAGLKTDNWRKYPRNMLFARAISNGARWYCPDIFNGPVYTPEEMGAQVEVIDGEARVIVEEPEPEPTVGPRPAAQIDEPADIDEEAKAAHFMSDSPTRNKFWAIARNDLGLTPADVHSILDVSSLWEYGETFEVAIETLREASEAAEALG